MIVAISIGRAGSSGLKNKNLLKVNNIPLMNYPLKAALNSKMINEVFFSSDSEKMNKNAKSIGAKLIDRPKKLSTKKSLADHVYIHCYNEIKKEIKKIDLIVLLMSNAICISTKQINFGINKLKKNKSYDSAVTVSKYNMWSPLRARKIDNNGLLKPFIDFKYFDNLNLLNCDRDSQGDVWFADMGVSIIRPKNLEKIEEGLLPQKWMGKKIYPIKQEGGFDIDFKWQIPSLSIWAKRI